MGGRNQRKPQRNQSVKGPEGISGSPKGTSLWEGLKESAEALKELAPEMAYRNQQRP